MNRRVIYYDYNFYPASVSILHLRDIKTSSSQTIKLLEIVSSILHGKMMSGRDRNNNYLKLDILEITKCKMQIKKKCNR